MARIKKTELTPEGTVVTRWISSGGISPTGKVIVYVGNRKFSGYLPIGKAWRVVRSELFKYFTLEDFLEIRAKFSLLLFDYQDASVQRHRRTAVILERDRNIAGMMQEDLDIFETEVPFIFRGIFQSLGDYLRWLNDNGAEFPPFTVQLFNPPPHLMGIPDDEDEDDIEAV
jgi:hypothetical protein